MANTKISQLPTWTGTANDLRWYIMNNSGETETYKFSGYTSGLVNGTGVDSVKSADWLTSTYGASIANGLGSVAIGSQAEAIGGQAIAIGWNTTATGDVSYAIGGSINATGLASIAIGYASNSSSPYSIFIGQEGNASGTQSIAMGRFSNATATNSMSFGSNSTASGENSISMGATISPSPYDINIGGSGKTFNDTEGYNVSIGGDTNIISGTRGFKTIINGYDNKILSNAKYAQIFGGYSNTIDGGDYGLSIIGGFNNTINSSTYGAGILSAFYSTINQCGTSVCVGGVGNTISNSNAGGIFGARACIVTNAYEDIGASIWGSWNSTITAGSPLAQIFGGDGNTIAGISKYSIIFGGSGNTISGITNAVMVGCSGRTATDEKTTYVENLKIFGQAQSNSNNVGSVSSGTTLDFNTGNIQYFQLTSGSTIVLDATNYKDGATYIVKVKQPTSGTNATMTFTSPLFKFPNGVAPTLSTGNNEEDILSFICIGTTLYGNIQKTFI